MNNAIDGNFVQRLHEFLIDNEWELIKNNANIQLFKCVGYDHITRENHSEYSKALGRSTIVKVLFMINGVSVVSVYPSLGKVFVYDQDLLSELLLIM